MARLYGSGARTGSSRHRDPLPARSDTGRAEQCRDRNRRTVPINIEELTIPVEEDVSGACEILGLDPLYRANQGRFIAFVPERETARALEIL